MAKKEKSAKSPENRDAELEAIEPESEIAEAETVSPSENEDSPEASSVADAPTIDPADDIEGRLASAQQELKAEQDRLMRLYAEFDNYKKRSAREMGEFRKYATESLVKELIPVVDNLERAISSSGEQTPEENRILEGVEMTLKEILRVLEKHGVKPIDSLGVAFDPNFHEAVGQEVREDAEADNIVVRELLKGYTMHERLIRPSMVIVSKTKPAENA